VISELHKTRRKSQGEIWLQIKIWSPICRRVLPPHKIGWAIDDTKKLMNQKRKKIKQDFLFNKYVFSLILWLILKWFNSLLTLSKFCIYWIDLNIVMEIKFKLHWSVHCLNHSKTNLHSQIHHEFSITTF